MQDTWVPSLGQEDPLEKGMAIHSSILAWRIPWTEETWQATVHTAAKSQTRLSNLHFYTRDSASRLHGDMCAHQGPLGPTLRC